MLSSLFSRASWPSWAAVEGIREHAATRTRPAVSAGEAGRVWVVLASVAAVHRWSTAVQRVKQAVRDWSRSGPRPSEYGPRALAVPSPRGARLIPSQRGCTASNHGFVRHASVT